MQDEEPTIEIISDQPLTPVISKVENPARLVVDLPHARLADKKNHLTLRSSEIGAVRVSQFKNDVARIVVDLAEPVNYRWDATGNLLTVHLRASEANGAPSVPGLTRGSQPAGVPASSGSGAVVLAGNRLAAGSSVTAGSDTAVLRLGRGGEVRVCPGTTVSVTPSQNGRSLMLGMSTGALEAHYALDESSDSILTPDFRLLLAGPGEFHFGINVDSRGNTCVQAMPGNTASVIVSELLGDGTYQVKPTQQVVFRSGQLKSASLSVTSSCGCPAPKAPVNTTLAELPTSQTPAASVAGQPNSLGTQPSKETAALPPAKPNDVHVQVDVPMVFRADDPETAPPNSEAKLLPVRGRQRPPSLQMTAMPPQKPPHRGFFGRVKGFFAAVFG